MKKVLLYLILIMAIGMAGTVAYVSVSGLLKVFAGAGTIGLIFFTTIETAKIIATSAIHTYGKIIGKFYNIILSLFIVIAMAITSMGIYGFLSSSYKETFTAFENVNAKITLLEQNKVGLQSQLDMINKEKESVTNTITELTKGLSNSVVQYTDNNGRLITSSSSATRKAFEKQLDRAIQRQGELNIKSETLSSNIFDVENKIMEIKVGDSSSSELGPLKYLADITGTSMDEVMKYFIILLIIIGDPMAVVMVIIFNKVVNHDKPVVKKKEITEVIEQREELKEELVTTKEEVEEEEEDYIDESVDIEILDNPVEENVFITPLPEVKEVEPPQFKPKEKKPITREDIKEIKESERGFSVSIPTRKKADNNTIERIGSNKEMRDGKYDKIYFKRR